MPALKTTLAIVTALRANLKAIICVEGGEGTPSSLGFQLSTLNTIIQNMTNHISLCQTIVCKLTRAKSDIEQLLIFLNVHVLKLHYQLYEQERMRDPQANQDPSPPQISNMRNTLAKMNVKLPELQEALERGDRSLLLTPINEAFAEYNPNAV